MTELDVARGWVRKAEEDRVAYQALSGLGKGAPLPVVCFHAQQSVEKYLKALLSARGVEFPIGGRKGHDLGELVKRVPPGEAVPLSEDEQATLSAYAVDVRYPEVETAVSAEQAAAAVALAEKVRGAVRARLPQTAL